MGGFRKIEQNTSELTHMFDAILEKCLSDESYKPKLSNRRKILIFIDFLLLIGIFVNYFYAFLFENVKTNEIIIENTIKKEILIKNDIHIIPFIFWITFLLLLIIFPIFAESLLAKYEETILDKINNRLIAVASIINGLVKNHSYFYKSHYFIDTVICEGEDKIKKAKENDIIPKILELLILPLVLASFSSDINIQVRTFLIAILTILVMIIILTTIIRIVSEIIYPKYRRYEWERLLYTLGLLKAKKQYSQRKIDLVFMMCE
jgi:hypothetical protein